MLFMVSCQKKDTQGGSSGKGKKNSVPAVKVKSIGRGDLESDLVFSGELISFKSAKISSRITGRLEKVVAKMGEKVKSGKVLVKIENGQLAAQLQEAEFALKVAIASVKRSEVDLASITSQLQRSKKLEKGKLITPQAMDNLRFKEKASRASLEWTKALKEQAAARVNILSAQKEETQLKAPFNGVVSARYLDPGNLVNPGVAVLEITRDDPVVVRFNVPERNLAQLKGLIKEGLITLKLLVDAFPGQQFQARSRCRLSPVIQAANRSASVEVEFPNKKGDLMPGMYCRVYLGFRKKSQVLILPLDALVDVPLSDSKSGEPESGVFVVKDNKVFLTPVKIGMVQREHGEILSGLKQGDQVVVAGMNSLKDGVKVLVINPK